jgi:DNA-binding MarR family transcriptional regulator
MGVIGAKSTSTVSVRLDSLAEKGWITRGPGPRMITIVDTEDE